MNALQHGMTASELVFEDDRERLQIWASDWQPELKAEGAFQRYQLEQMAASAVLIERCKEQEADYRYRQASRTQAGRDLDLSVVAEHLAAGLPRRPAQVARRLQQTIHGSEWLLARLRMLMEMISRSEANGQLRPLEGENRDLALDVLGVAPELRQGPTELDLPAGAGTVPAADLAAHQARVIAERIADLERFKTVDLAEVEAIDRDANTLGREIKVDPEIVKIRRYMKDAQRAMNKAHAELLRLQGLAAEAARTAAQAAAQAAADASAVRREFTGNVLMSQPSPVARVDSAVPAAPPAATPGPVPVPRVQPVSGQPVSAQPVSAPPDELHLAFEAALRETVPQKVPRRAG